MAVPRGKGEEPASGTAGDGDGDGDRGGTSKAPPWNGVSVAAAVGSGVGRSSVRDNFGGNVPRWIETRREGEPGRGGRDGGGEGAAQGEEKNEATRQALSSRDARGAEKEQQEEEEQAVSSIPRAGLLRLLRKPGDLRRKVMASDAVRPILTDRDFTEVITT